MPPNPRILAIVPCYNEEENIANVVAELEALKQESGLDLSVLVVNDCSKDASAQVLATLGCPHLNLPINLGLWGVMQCGYKYALRNNFDIAIQVDGDGQHPPHQIPKLLKPILAGDSDVMIGSRFIEKQGYQSSVLRRVGIRFFKGLVQWLVGHYIYDTTSGFKAFNRKAISLVCRHFPDEYPEMAAIILFQLKGLKISETAVIMRERVAGASYLNSTKAFIFMVKMTLEIIFVFLRFRLGFYR